MAKHSAVSLNLLVDTQSNRVLFAEAGKDCVDFLFQILSLPVANLISLVGKRQMVGSLPNLYESLENLSLSYTQPHQAKDNLLKPECGLMMEQEPGSEMGGFVKGGAMSYMVMDDLTVLPMSALSSLSVLNKFEVKDVGFLEEKLVSMGMLEAVKLVKASLETTSVLTRVFMNDVGSEEKEDVMSSEKKTASWFDIARNNNSMVDETNQNANFQGVFRFGYTSASVSKTQKRPSISRSKRKGFKRCMRWKMRLFNVKVDA